MDSAGSLKRKNGGAGGRPTSSLPCVSMAFRTICMPAALVGPGPHREGERARPAQHARRFAERLFGLRKMQHAEADADARRNFRR